MKYHDIALLGVVCMTCRSYIQTAAEIQSRQRFEQLHKWLIYTQKNWRQFPVILAVLLHPSLARLALSIGQIKLVEAH